MVFIIDISGRVIRYDISLYVNIIKEKSDEEIRLLVADAPKLDSNVVSMLHLIPSRLRGSNNRFVRIGKAIEVFLNYIYILFLCIAKRPSVLHFQWFPFLDYCAIEKYFVSFVKLLLPKSKLILTIHNLYPHDMTSTNQGNYRQRFNKVTKYLNGFIVHIDNSKEELVRDFGIQPQKISVIPHGVFEPDYVPKNRRNLRGHHIIMYGNNTPYKGVDVLLDALQLLPKELKEDVKVTIAGKGPEDYLALLRTKAEGLNVNFMPYFIPDDQLYSMIDEADYIALPYRKISQSGVLLLALFFEKPLLVSNIPSFVETLKGFTSEMFFESENPKSMMNLLERHLSGSIDLKKQLDAITNLRELYSWRNSAKQTLALYKKVDNESA